MKKMLIQALLLIPLSLGYFSHTSNASPSYYDKPRMSVYDQRTKNFIQRKKGVADKVLNSIDNPYLKEYFTTQEAIRFYEEVEFNEQNLKFSPDPEFNPCSTRSRSTIDTEKTKEKNMELIYGLKKGSIKDSYDKIKALLSKTDEIVASTNDELETIAKIYDFLQENLAVKKEDTNKSLSLVEILEKRKGDCNDLSPAFYSIIRIYGINIELVYGGVSIKRKDYDWFVGNHTWLRVKLKSGQTFDLDPRWHDRFVPLEPRSGTTFLASEPVEILFISPT